MTNYQFLIDWNNDGDFSDPYEDVTEYTMDCSWNIGFDEPYQHVAGETRLNMRLRNNTRLFSPENTGGSLYGSILPQRKIKVQYVDGGTTMLYQGWIQEVNPAPGTTGDLTVQISAIGVKQFLERQDYYSPFWEGVTADEVINDIVSTIQLPVVFDNILYIDIPGQNLIDTHWITDTSVFIQAETGKTTFDYVGDTWDEGVPAIRAINDLVQSERGWFFNDRSGSVVFWNRHHLIVNNTMQGTLDNSWYDMDYRYSSTDIKNMIKVMNYPRSLSTASDDILWRLESAKSIPPNGTANFRASYSEQDSDSKVSGRNVTTPNTGDGSLVVTPVGASYALTVEEDKARSMKLKIVNSDTQTISVDTILIKGQKVTAYNEEEIEVNDGISIGTYGKHTMEIDYRLLDDDDFANAIANYELGQRKDARGVVRSVSVNHRYRDFLINRTIGDWIRVIDGQTGHDEEYVIMGERHRWSVGDKHTTEYVLQSTATVNFIIIDTHDIDSGRYIAV